MTWEQIYDYFGIRDFIYFISSPGIQEMLFPVKLVFIFFAMFFLCAVIYFYFKSSYMQYQFLQDITEFFSWRAYGLREVEKRWNKIKKNIKSGTENEYKLAIIEADDFLYQTLEESGYQGETFEELVNNVSKKMMPNLENILDFHSIRNSIVYYPSYRLDLEKAKKILSDYESTIKNLSLN